MAQKDEEDLLRSVALRNVKSILNARERAEAETLRTKDELHKLADRLQLALVAGRLGDWSWNAADDAVTLGPQAAAVLGVPPGESVTWAGLREFLHEDDRERARLAVEQAIETRSEYSIEYRVRHPTLGLRWIAARGLATYAHDGSVLGMIGVVQDISDRKRAEEALLETQTRLRMAIEAGQMGDWEWTLANGRVRWSPEIEAIHGLPPGAFGGSFEDYQSDIHPEDRPRVLDSIRASVANRTDYRMEYRIIKPDGAITWIEARGKPFLDANGNPERLVGICMDATSRKFAEEELRDEGRILELLHRTGTMLTSKLELDALLQAITDATTRLSGALYGAFFYNSTDENGDAYLLYTLSGAPREAFEAFGQPRATPLFGPTFRGEAPVRIDDVTQDPRYGQWAPHKGMPPGHLPLRSYLGVPVKMASGEVIGGLFFGHPNAGVFTERTERIVEGISKQAVIAIDNARLYETAQKAADERTQLLERERLARAEAERANAMKDEFLATLSHELRTPLSAILGWSQVLKQGVDEADLQRGIDAVERNARVQVQLIEDLLDMSRITAGTMRLEIAPVDAISIIDAAIDTVRPAAEAKQIAIEKQLDPAAGAVRADPGRLQQIIWNLLSNAIKFTPDGGRVRVALEHAGKYAELRVDDTGIGIAPEFLPFVFERFRQADASTTRTAGGLGLGLSIVKNLVELHGGRVRVESKGPSLGAAFIVTLPLATASSAAEPCDGLIAEARMGAAQSSALSGLSILVVDDDVDAGELVEHVLTRCGARVFTARTAEQALAFVERERPHVLVSDIGMPNVDGYELLRRVRALGSEKGGAVPAIALTAFARAEDRARALRAGFQVHVSKPVEPSDLVASVASSVGRIAR